MSLQSSTYSETPFLKNFIRSFSQFLTGIIQGMQPVFFYTRLANKYMTTIRSRVPIKSVGISISEKYSICTQMKSCVIKLSLGFFCYSTIFFFEGAIVCQISLRVFLFITSNIVRLSFFFYFSFVIGFYICTVSVSLQQLKYDMRLS